MIKKPRSLNSYIFAGLGKVWMWWPPRNEVKKRCKVEGKSGWFRCELCKQEREKIDVDHISPVVPVSGFTTWDNYIAARFVTADKLQGICKDCHKAKTKEENQRRREIKKQGNGITLFCGHDDSSWCDEKCPRMNKKEKYGK